jgi:hypothetical protein
MSRQFLRSAWCSDTTAKTPLRLANTTDALCSTGGAAAQLRPRGLVGFPSGGFSRLRHEPKPTAGRREKTSVYFSLGCTDVMSISKPPPTFLALILRRRARPGDRFSSTVHQGQTLRQASKRAEDVTEISVATSA